MPKFATLSLAFALIASANANVLVGSYDCFVATASLDVGSSDFPQGIVGEAKTTFVASCGTAAAAAFGQESFTCDVSSDFVADYEKFVNGCTGLGGQLKLTSWSICAEQFLPAGSDSVSSFPDLEIVNMPICLAPTICDANTDIIATYKQFLAPYDESTRIYNDDLCIVATPAPVLPTPAPAPAILPTPAPTANSGGGKAAKCFLY